MANAGSTFGRGVNYTKDVAEISKGTHSKSLKWDLLQNARGPDLSNVTLDDEASTVKPI